MEQEWIRDRRPTAADGDCDGDVEMVSAPGTDFDDYVLVHWSYVGDAAPWRHTSLWKPPAQPEPIGGSIINCRWDGPPPSPHSSISGWFEQEGSKGILQGLRISALPSRGGSSTGFPEGQPSRAEKHSPEADRIAALEQRVVERDRAQSVLVAALVKRLEALEGVQADGTVPAKVPGGIAALANRLKSLETLFWAHNHPASITHTTPAIPQS